MKQLKITQRNVFITLALILLMAYVPQYFSDFIGDDISRIQDHWETLSLSNLHFHPLGDRPVLLVSIWADINLFQLTPGLMKLENVLLLILIANLMFSLANTLSEKFNIQINEIYSTLIIFIFCLHPLVTQVVDHVVQRGILLTTIFGLSATILLLKSEAQLKTRNGLLALLFWILAILSKPNIVFLLLVWIYLFHQLNFNKIIKNLLPFFLTILIPIYLYFWGNFNSQSYTGGITSWDYFLAQGEVIFTYLRLALFPVGLKFNHDFLYIHPVSFYPYFLFWIFYAFVLYAVFKFIKPSIIAFIFSCSFIALIPESSFFAIMHFIFEHRFFLPLLFITLGFVLLTGRMRPSVTGVILSLIVFIFFSLTIKRNMEVRLWSDWAEQELSHTCNVLFLQHTLTARLIKRGEIKNLGRAISSLENCSSVSPSFIANKSLYKLAATSGISTHEIDQLKEFLHSDNNLAPEVRIVVTGSVEKILQDKGLLQGNSCLMEDFYAVQLRQLSRQLPFTVSLMKNYLRFSQMCLKTLEQKNTGDEEFQRYKIRTILYYYFNKNDNLLKKDLERKHGSNRYDYLLELYNSK